MEKKIVDIKKTYQGKTALQILKNAHISKMRAGNYEIVTKTGLIVRSWAANPNMIGLQDDCGGYVTHLELSKSANELHCNMMTEICRKMDQDSRYE